MATELLIVSGMSGAGKSTALGVLEDVGYFCMDNVPPDLLADLFPFIQHSSMSERRIAAVVDVRAGESFGSMGSILSKLRNMGINVKIIFLDSKDDILVNRYNLTRRRHPLSENGRTIDELIKRERYLLSDIKEMSDYTVDTSLINPHELRRKMVEIAEGRHERVLKVSVESFGFKYGMPIGADFVFDARFLPNPYYIKELADKTGNDPEVRRYFGQFEVVEEYASKISELLALVVDSYSKEGKNVLYVAVGCSGGRHRSVYLVNRLAELLNGRAVFSVSHRDISR